MRPKARSSVTGASRCRQEYLIRCVNPAGASPPRGRSSSMARDLVASAKAGSDSGFAARSARSSSTSPTCWPLALSPANIAFPLELAGWEQGQDPEPGGGTAGPGRLGKPVPTPSVRAPPAGRSSASPSPAPRAPAPKVLLCDEATRPSTRRPSSADPGTLPQGDHPSWGSPYCSSTHEMDGEGTAHEGPSSATAVSSSRGSGPVFSKCQTSWHGISSTPTFHPPGSASQSIRIG